MNIGNMGQYVMTFVITCWLDSFCSFKPEIASIVSANDWQLVKKWVPPRDMGTFFFKLQPLPLSSKLCLFHFSLPLLHQSSPLLRIMIYNYNHLEKSSGWVKKRTIEGRGEGPNVTTSEEFALKNCVVLYLLQRHAHMIIVGKELLTQIFLGSMYKVHPCLTDHPLNWLVTYMENAPTNVVFCPHMDEKLL